MKTILCGPPHSGKSVLFANLQELLPTDSFQRITANGDGEGAWSNNPNQEDVMSVRVKTKNSPEEFAFWTQLIREAQKDIVLIDIGGRIQDDKIPIFEASDSFIIVCSRDMQEKDPDIIDKWKAFGTSNGCECLAIITTVLDGNEEIYSTEPLLKCQLSGLERGHYILESHVLKNLAETIIAKSEYIPTINFHEISHRLKCCRTWKTKEGISVEHSIFPQEIAPELWRLLKSEYSNFGPTKLVGADSNWVACVAATCLCTSASCHIRVFDYWTNTFIQLSKLEKHETPNEMNNGLIVEITENEQYVKLQYNIPDLGIDTTNFSKYKIPHINESKKLLISGRFPNWFMASIVLSYNSEEKYIHIPGKGYVCVESKDENKLGSYFTY